MSSDNESGSKKRAQVGGRQRQRRVRAAVERSLEHVGDFDDFLRDGLDVPEVDEGSDSNASCDAPDVRLADPDNRAEPGSESVASAVLQLGQDEAALLKEMLFFQSSR